MKVLNKLDMSGNSVENARFELIPVIPGGTEDNIVTIDENGQLVDSGVNISEVGGGGGDMSNYYTKSEVNAALEEKQDVIGDLDDIRSGAALGATAIQSHQDISGKQDVLVSGTNIKTINNQSLLGEGNIVIEGGGGSAVQSDWNQSDTEADDYIKNKPTIPDVSNFVTEDHVYEMGFATMEDIPDVSDFVTQNDVATYLSENNYATTSDIPDVSSFITENDLSTYLGDNSYITSTYLSENNYATTSDIPDVSNFITEDHVYEMGFATQDDISNFITESDLSDYLSNNSYATQSDIPDVSEFITENDVASYLSNNSYITESDMSDYLSNNSYITESDMSDYLSNNSYITESGMSDYLSEYGYMDEYSVSEYLSNNNYINDSNIETAIAPYIGDFITDEVLTKYVTEINTKPNFATVTIEDSDTSGSYTYTIGLSTYNITGTPMVQVIYDGQVLFSDITIAIDTENDEVTVTWDDSKYSVDSNNPLTVTIMGLAPEEQ